MSVASRRSFLKFGLKVSVVGVTAVALQACGSKSAADSAACVDVGGLTASEQSLRQSMNYVEKAPDPTKTCAGCSFFTAGEGAAGCGSCEIFTGGPANPGGHCDSWAAKPA
jgi:High potential iron-sulfur protein